MVISCEIHPIVDESDDIVSHSHKLSHAQIAVVTADASYKEASNAVPFNREEKSRRRMDLICAKQTLMNIQLIGPVAAKQPEYTCAVCLNDFDDLSIIRVRSFGSELHNKTHIDHICIRCIDAIPIANVDSKCYVCPLCRCLCTTNEDIFNGLLNVKVPRIDRIRRDQYEAERLIREEIQRQTVLLDQLRQTANDIASMNDQKRILAGNQGEKHLTSIGQYDPSSDLFLESKIPQYRIHRCISTCVIPEYNRYFVVAGHRYPIRFQERLTDSTRCTHCDWRVLDSDYIIGVERANHEHQHRIDEESRERCTEIKKEQTS